MNLSEPDPRGLASGLVAGASGALGVAAAGAAWAVVVAVAVALGVLVFGASVVVGLRFAQDPAARWSLAKEMVALSLGLVVLTLVILHRR